MSDPVTNSIQPVEIDHLEPGSTCVGRNGTFEVQAARLTPDNAGLVKLEFVSRGLNRVLNAGAELSTLDMDQLCVAWLRARGGLKKHHEAVVEENDRLRKALADVVRSATNAIDS